MGLLGASIAAAAAWDNNIYDSNSSVTEDLPPDLARLAWPYRHMEQKATFVAPYRDADTMELAVEVGKRVWHTRMTAYFNVAVWLQKNNATGNVLEISGETLLMNYFKAGYAHRRTNENVLMLHKTEPKDAYDYVIADQVRGEGQASPCGLNEETSCSAVSICIWLDWHGKK